MRYSSGFIGFISLLGVVISPAIVWAESSSVKPALENVSSSQPIQLTLPDVITLLLQNSRELKNSALDRITQRQQLREAEQVFTPRFQPYFGIGMSHLLAAGTSVTGVAPLSSPSVSGLGSGGSVTDSLGNKTTLTRATSAIAQVKTPLGTNLTVTVDPFYTQKVSVNVTQPLLRGSGQTINRAPVTKARLTDARNHLELRKTLSNQITEAGIRYRAIAKAQETLNIQKISLANQHQQYELTQVLVTAGRKPKNYLIDIEANIAATQSALLQSQNALDQAKSALLTLLNLDKPLNFEIPQTLIDGLKSGEIPVPSQSLAELVQIAYAQRSEYLQAELDTQIAQSDRHIARDNQRWGLDLQAIANLGDRSAVAAGVVLTRVFNDPALKTELTQREVEVLKRSNDLLRLKDTIRLEVESRWRDLTSARDRIAASRKAR